MNILEKINLFLETTGDKGFTVYHRDIFFPNGWSLDVDNFIRNIPEKLDFGNTHYRSENKDRPKIRIEKSNINKKDIFEIKYLYGKLREIAVRLKTLSKEYDVTYVIAKDGGILTSWDNNKNDHHKNLKDENYSRDPNKGRI